MPFPLAAALAEVQGRRRLFSSAWIREMDALFIYATVSVVVNACILVVVAVVNFDNSHPIDGSSAEQYHSISNIAFALALVPHVLRRHSRLGMGEDAERRSQRLVTYSMTTGLLSCIHHSFSLGKSEVYTDGVLEVLWQSLDWCFARMTTPVVLFNMVSPNALARVASPGEGGWVFRAGVEVASATLFFGVLLRDVSFISTEPFSTYSATFTVTAGTVAFFSVVSMIIVSEVSRVPAALAAHFWGSRSAVARTANLVVCVAASAATWAEGDDPSGWVHASWHCATASTIAAAVALTFDESLHLPPAPPSADIIL